MCGTRGGSGVGGRGWQIGGGGWRRRQRRCGRWRRRQVRRRCRRRQPTGHRRATGRCWRRLTSRRRHRRGRRRRARWRHRCVDADQCARVLLRAIQGHAHDFRVGLQDGAHRFPLQTICYRDCSRSKQTAQWNKECNQGLNSVNESHYCRRTAWRKTNTNLHIDAVFDFDFPRRAIITTDMPHKQRLTYEPNARVLPILRAKCVNDRRFSAIPSDDERAIKTEQKIQIFQNAAKKQPRSTNAHPGRDDNRTKNAPAACDFFPSHREETETITYERFFFHAKCNTAYARRRRFSRRRRPSKSRRDTNRTFSNPRHDRNDARLGHPMDRQPKASSVKRRGE